MSADKTREIAEASLIADVAGLSEDTARERLLAVLGRYFGTDVAGMRKLGHRRSLYVLVLANGESVDLGSAADILNQRSIRAAIAEATGNVLPSVKPWVWDMIAAAIFRAAAVEETDNAPEHETTHWLRQAKMHAAPITLDRGAPAKIAQDLRDGANQPIYSGRGEMFVSLPSLIRSVHVTCGVRVPWPEMALRLRKLGFKPEQLTARDHEGVVKARLWTSPRGFSLDE